MDKRAVKVILLDAGGVLFDTFVKHDERIIQFMINRGYLKQDVEAAIKRANHYISNQGSNKIIKNWEEEKEYYITYYEKVSIELGNVGLAEELFSLAHYAAHCELFPEVLDTLEELRAHYKLGIISNAMPSMEWVFDRLDIKRYFDQIILSCSVNQSKPDAKIYQLALRQFQSASAETIFVDDKRRIL